MKSLIPSMTQRGAFPAAALMVLLTMYLLFPFATGYEAERMTVWDNMRNGYSLDGGEWSFGYVVPWAVLVLFWLTRKRYAEVSIQPSWWGLAILVFGCFLYFAGYKTNEKYIAYVSGQVLVAGAVFWFLGKAWFQRLFWLWVLFGMTWPLGPLFEEVSFALQKGLAASTEWVLRTLGEGVERIGTSVFSAATETMERGERFSLKVAAACAGLRSLFALIMISIAYAYLILKKDWHRWVLVASAVPLAVLGNLVRMMLLYVGTITMGSEFAIGKGELDPSAYHILAGLMVFIVALSGMVAFAGLLEKKGRWWKRSKAQIRRSTAQEGGAA
ncbi:MAG: exosortase/archaeosortase family protein [Verrucomicrobiota bacterium]